MSPLAPHEDAALSLVDLRQLHAGSGAWLSTTEQTRADRFAFERDRRRYIAGRTALRSLLAAALDCNPAAVELETTEHGRPVCAALRGDMDFNLSNAEDSAVIAFARSAPVGVDIEVLRPVSDATELAAQFFSPMEALEICALHGMARDHAFLTCWTRKEAVLKATGLGLYIDPATVVAGTQATAAIVRTTQGTFAVQSQSMGNAIVSIATPQSLRTVSVRSFDAATPITSAA